MELKYSNVLVSWSQTEVGDMECVMMKRSRRCCIIAYARPKGCWLLHLGLKCIANEITACKDLAYFLHLVTFVHVAKAM